MAEILVKAVDHNHPDPDTDRAGCYKAGMPVVVMEDGHHWGGRERLPDFWVLKLPNVSVERVRQFIEPHEVDDGLDPDGNPQRKTYRRRMWRILVESLPAGAKAKIASQGSITIGQDGDYTWSQFKNYMRNLRDNVNAGDI